MANIFSHWTDSIVSENKIIMTIDTPDGPMNLTAAMAEHPEDYPKWAERIKEMQETVEAVG